MSAPYVSYMCSVYDFVIQVKGKLVSFLILVCLLFFINDAYRLDYNSFYTCRCAQLLISGKSVANTLHIHSLRSVVKQKNSIKSSSKLNPVIMKNQKCLNV